MRTQEICGTKVDVPDHLALAQIVGRDEGKLRLERVDVELAFAVQCEVAIGAEAVDVLLGRILIVLRPIDLIVGEEAAFHLVVAAVDRDGRPVCRQEPQRAVD